VPLAPFTTFEVGGPARFFAEPTTEADAAAVLAWARGEGLAVTVLAGGSNVLVADRGLDGLVLRPRILGVRPERLAGGEVRVEVGAGEPLDGLVARVVAEGWAGLECLSGIPGWVGATPIQNVGAYGQEVSTSIAEVRGVDRATGELLRLPADACGFGYRTSVFKGAMRDRWLVTSVVLRLRAGAPAPVRYAELSRALAEAPGAGLAEIRAAVLALRRAKSMVVDPADPNRRSAGSFFTNPVVADAVADEVARLAEGAGGAAASSMPRWPAGDGRAKLSAAWLIERAGLARGAGEGPVGLSTRHTLAIVNRGGARAAEVVAFAASVRRRVLESFGVALSPEPDLLGFTEAEIVPLTGPAM
jgi:UDP-N-acetylmuramate dehydrogenase